MRQFSCDSLERTQVVSQYSSLLAPLAVEAVLNVRDLDRPDSVDLRDIKVLRKLGGTVSLTLECERYLHGLNERSQIVTFTFLFSPFLSRLVWLVVFLSKFSDLEVLDRLTIQSW